MSFVGDFRTAFYALSLIAQTPDGAVSLKEFGWETYRVRSHSIPTSITNTDTHQSSDRRLSRAGLLPSSPRKSISLQVTPPPLTTSSSPTSSITDYSTEQPSSRRENHGPLTVDVSSAFKFSQQLDPSSGDIKSKRSLTMPSSILLNVNEKNDVRSGKQTSTEGEKNVFDRFSFQW